MKETTTQNIQEIKDSIVPTLKDEVIDVVKKQVKEEVMSSVRSTWIAIQKQRVWEHEHCVLIFNFNFSTSPPEAVRALMRNELKISEENALKISIKQSYRIGKGSASRPPPLFVRFGHPSERGIILSHTKNLVGKRINIEKSVPKNYESAYKKFKEQSFKFRNMPGLEYQTQIYFDGHLMHLRTKVKDTSETKYQFKIEDTFEPPMEAESAASSTIQIPEGTVPSPLPEASIMTKANSSLFFSVKSMTEEITEDTFKRNFMEYLSENHRPYMIDFKMKRKDLAVVFFDSWENASTVAKTYKDNFMGHAVNFTLFSEKNPSSPSV